MKRSRFKEEQIIKILREVESGKKVVDVKITSLFFLMLLVAMVNFVTVYFYLTQQQYDTHVVNVAGRQRMLSQRISKLALSVAGGEDADRRPQTSEKIYYDV